MKKHILLYISTLFLVSAVGQEYHQADSFLFYTQEIGSQMYEAKEYIKLLKGFNYSTQGDSSFTAKVNNKLLDLDTDGVFQHDLWYPANTSDSGYTVGTIPGEFNVSPTGAATYTIPIAVPPGVMGLQPKISLNYNSQARNDIAGWGWSIAGLSSITRASNSIFHDGASSGIHWNSEDALVLDGQRLIEVVNDGNTKEYRTEVDNGSKIIAYGITTDGPSYLKVFTKDGKVLTYDAILSSRVQYVTIDSIYQWHVSKIEDRNGNYLSFNYDKEFTVYEGGLSTAPYNYNADFRNFRVSSITYGNSSHFSAEVKFEYEGREDTIINYSAGFKVEQGKRLQAIKILSNSTLLKTYTLVYENTKDRLLSVELEGKDNYKFRKTVFDWGESGDVIKQYKNTYVYNEQGKSINDFSTLWWYSSDYNNDGLDDLFALGSENNSPTFQFYKAWNYYGRREFRFEKKIVKNTLKEGYISEGTNLMYWHIGQPVFSNFTSLQEKSLLIPFIKQDTCKLFFLNPLTEEMDSICIKLKSETNAIPPLCISDFNKDGYMDIFIIEENWNVQSGCYPGRFILGKEGGVIQYNDIPFQLPNTSGAKPKRVIAADFNSDGMSDIMILTEDGFIILNMYKHFTGSGYGMYLISNNSSLVFSGVDLSLNDAIKYIRRPTGQHSNEVCTGDFNGDGVVDLLYNDSENNANYFMLNDGKGSFTKKRISKNSNHNEHSDQVFIIDFNNDAKDDVIFADQADYVSWCMSTGYDVEEVEYITQGNDDFYCPITTILKGDYNGDGMLDILSLKSTLTNNTLLDNDPRIHYPYNTNKNHNLIESITDGFGNKIEVEYDNSIEEDLYVKGETTASKILDFLPKTRLVQKVKSKEGVDSTLYSYSDGLFHVEGKGFLGFRKSEAIRGVEDEYKTTTISEAKLDTNLCALLPYKTIKKDNNDDIEREKIQGVIVSPYPSSDSKVYRSYTQYITDKFKNTGTTTRFSSFDDAGNPCYIKTEYIGANPTVTYQVVKKQYTSKGSWCKYQPSQVISTNYNGEDTVSHQVDYFYNNDGNLVRMVNDTSEIQQVTTTYSNFDNFGNPQVINVTAPNDTSVDERTTQIAYTDDSRFVKSKTVDEYTTNYEYDLTLSQLKSEESSTGLKTYYFYDGMGRCNKTQLPNGVESYSLLRWAFKDRVDFHPQAGYFMVVGFDKTDENSPDDALYYEETMTSGQAPVLTFYNKQNQEIRIVSEGFDGEKIYQDKEYYKDGKLHYASNPYFKDSTILKTRYKYDYNNRLKEAYTPDGTYHKTEYYDSQRKVINKVSKSGKTQQSIIIKNPQGLTISSTDNENNTVNYAYYADGQMKKCWVNDTTITSFEYDLHGNRTLINDPDAGLIKTKYDAFGQLREHENARGQATTYTYDSYGRLQSEMYDNQLTSYQYYSKGPTRGMLEKVSVDNKERAHYEYNRYGQLNRFTDRHEDGNMFISSIKYDDYGRVKEQVYPSGYTVSNTYNSRGYLKDIRQDDDVIYENTAYTAMGALTAYKLGQTNVENVYDDYGRLKSQAHPLQTMNYTYDSFNNLESRSMGDQAEFFYYDDLNRLEAIDYFDGTSSTPQFQSFMDYDASGNMTKKTGVSDDMRYGPYTTPQGVQVKAGPHALTSIQNPQNYTPPTQEIDYTHFNKVQEIRQYDETNNVTHSYTYTYGIDQQREKTVYKEGDAITRTKYYHGNYEKVVEDGVTKEYHYLAADAGLFAIFVKTNGGNGELKYVLTDHLGSLTKIIDAESGIAEHSASYDAWGQPRSADDWMEEFSGTLFADRGFTGHEHLPAAFGLIDMNGRMYDPKLGRFLSPDPYVQSPEYSQSLNRYSYCLNNPLSYFDPMGEAWITIFNEDGTTTSYWQDPEDYKEEHMDDYMSNPDHLEWMHNNFSDDDWDNLAYEINKMNGYSMTYINYKGGSENGFSYHNRTHLEYNSPNLSLTYSALSYDLGNGDSHFESVYSMDESNRGAWISDVWNSDYIRKRTGDALVINTNITFAGFDGFSFGIGLIVPLRGPDAFQAHLSLFGSGIRVGAEATAGFSVGKAFYNGAVDDAYVSYMGGYGRSISVGYIVGVDLWRSYADDGRVTWQGANFSIGYGLGVSYGEDNTIVTNPRK